MSLPFIGETFALGAAFCWAIGPLIAYRGIAALGTFRFSMYRFAFSSLVLFLLSALLGQVEFLDVRSIIYLAFSGVIGVAVGEACLFQAVFLLGPRISSIIFSLHAPLTAFIGAMIFQETISLLALLGIFTAIIGVYIAIIFRTSSERIGGEFYKSELFFKGLYLAVLAVIFQIIGALLSKEVIASVGIFHASFIRTFSASLAFFPIYIYFKDRLLETKISDLKYIIISACVSTIGGMTLLLAAFASTEIFRAVVLASMSPILYIFLMSIFRGERFPVLAWGGTILAVIGVILTITSA